MNRSDRALRRRPAAGFTVIEMTITLLIFSVLLVAMLTLFDQSNKLARAQTNIADMQQSLRIGVDEIVRTGRTAGRGWDMNPALAVQVLNNPGGTITTAAINTTAVLPGTDVLILRGVISGSLFEVTTGNTNSKEVVINEFAPSGRNQDLTDLYEALDNGLDDAIMIIGSNYEAALVELDTGASTKDEGAGTTTLKFLTAPDGTNATAFGTFLTGVAPPWLASQNSIRMIGVFEEYRYYVRANRVDPADATSEAQPRLSVARVFPGTESAWAGNNANLQIDIADDIADLQFAVGVDLYTIDTDADGVNDEGDGNIVEIGLASDDDEWFYNVAGDADPPVIFTGGDLHFVRTSVLARTHRREIRYVAPAITGAIEDRDYSEKAANDPTLTDAEAFARGFHRRLLQTVIDFRNI